jgi:hypothetical protein
MNMNDTKKALEEEAENPRNVLERVEKLEGQNRRFRRAGSALLIFVGAILLMGQAAPRDSEIAKKFFATENPVLTDATGKIRASLVADEKGARFNFSDSHGKPKIILVSDERGARLVFSDSHGEPKMALALDEDEPKISLYDTGGQLHTTISPHSIFLTDDTTGGTALSARGIRINDDTSGRTVSMAAFSSGAGVSLTDGSGLRANLVLLPLGPSLFLYDKRSEKSATLRYTDTGPSLELEDTRGYTAILGSGGLETPTNGESHQTSAASLVLFNKEKKVIWKAP